MKKKYLSLMAVVLMCSTTLVSCGGDSGSNNSGSFDEAANTFSVWQPYGADSGYYSNFSDNPVVSYLTKQKTWGDDKASLKFNYSIPGTGSESSSFNTMMAADELTDLFVPYINGSLNLYNSGYIMDITDYVNKYMPNYLAWLDKHPAEKSNSFVNINGEKRILELYDYSDSATPWCGYSYRRDWLVKYGTNPVTGAAFTGGWSADGKTWTDDVVFPTSKTKEPIYISDWEWMFGIFTKALKAENISDGYCTTIYYPGYLGTGDLVSSFGGGGPIWYKKDGTVYFGGTSDNFRAYLQGMNTWYKNGWIDKHFTERTSEMFYQTDTKGVTTGKVGLWYGPSAYLGGKMKNMIPDSCIYYAKDPINDIYGPDSAKNVAPFTLFQPSLTGLSLSVNSKAAGKKNLPALFNMLDYLYSDEGSMLMGLGLSKEQYEESQDSFYTSKGLTNGAYSWVDKNGADWVEGTSTGDKLYKLDQKLIDDSSLATAATGTRIIGRKWGTSNKYWTEDPVFVESCKAYMEYKATGWFTNAETNAETADEAAEYSGIYSKVNEFMGKTCPTFINGSKDPFNDSTWSSYCSGLNKYKPDNSTKMFQRVVDLFK
ncbi:MAG: hypothetical protein LKJ88_07345 [Bacilli bacterium]|jgi:hypothetical protein|nr:hypothetical protein [Bacilli bacterium]